MAGSQRGDKRGCFGGKGRATSKVTWYTGIKSRGVRGSKTPVNWQENLFIFLGLMFIIFTLPIQACWYVRVDPARSEAGVAAARAEELIVGEWYASVGPRSKSKVPVDWLLRRNAMMQSVSLYQPKDFDADCIRWMVHSLEKRPKNYVYDLRCINLLGRLREHLKALDSILAEKLVDNP